MAAASGFDLIKNFSNYSFSDLNLLIAGFLVSFSVALASISFFLKYIKSNNFIPFGIYRIIIAVLFLLYL